MRCLHECHYWHTHIGLSKHYLIKPWQTAAKVKKYTKHIPVPGTANSFDLGYDQYLSAVQSAASSAACVVIPVHFDCGYVSDVAGAAIRLLAELSSATVLPLPLYY